MKDRSEPGLSRGGSSLTCAVGGECGELHVKVRCSGDNAASHFLLSMDRKMLAQDGSPYGVVLPSIEAVFYQ